MLATGFLIIFILMINKIKVKSIRLIKEGNLSAVFVLIAIKLLFWLCIVEISYIWIGNKIVYILPIVFLIFTSYLLMERKMIITAITGKSITRLKLPSVKMPKFNQKKRAKSTD